MAAGRQVIILEQVPAKPGFKAVKVAFWYTIQPPAQYPRAGYASQVLDSILTQNNQPILTQAEKDALIAGTVVEEIEIFVFPANSMSGAQQLAFLQAAWTDRTAAINAAPNMVQYYGKAWDSTAWSASTVQGV